MKRLEFLDYGRFFAAICVVLYHYTFHGINSGKITSISYNEELINFTKYGYLGVELFFMISGYVIFYSSKNKSATEFAVSRATRLYPAFWTALIITTTASLFWGGPLMSVSLPQFVANISMAPKLLGFDPVDGAYWTLFVELEFYLLVFIVLFSGHRHWLNTLFLLWPFVIIAANLAGLEDLPYLGGLFGFFAAGAIFAIAKEKRTVKVIAPLLVTFAHCIYYSADQASYMTQIKRVEFSGVITGLIISLFFVFFTLLISKKGSGIRLPKSSLLGALSYPIYLTHNHLGYMLISKYATGENKAIVIALTITIVVALAYTMHYIIEVKLRKTWKILFHTLVGKPFIIIQRRSAALKLWLKTE